MKAEFFILFEFLFLQEIMKGLLRNFDIYSAEELMALAQTEEMGFTIERLPFGEIKEGTQKL